MESATPAATPDDTPTDQPIDQPNDQPNITQLPERVAALPPDARAVATRLFQMTRETGTLVPPPEMNPWLARTFGSVAATERQRIVRVTNRWTYEGATFNSLRALRPGVGAPSAEAEAKLRELIAASQGDDFCDPEHKTPADAFGRVRGAHVLTSSNVAKADGWHAVGIFDRHDPLAIDPPLVADILAVAGEWARRAHGRDADARHLFLLWNCLPRAGASLIHGHVQMTLGRAMPHARVALWRDAAQRYRRDTGHDYFTDLLATYRALGLAADSATATTLATLTPIKEREIDIIAPIPSGATTADALPLLAAPLAHLLDVALHTWNVRAFNVAIFGPPLAAPSAPGNPGNPGNHNDFGDQSDWAGFPLVARFVDRGNPAATTADVAALELFGSSVVAADPFPLARALEHRTHT